MLIMFGLEASQRNVFSSGLYVWDTVAVSILVVQSYPEFEIKTCLNKNLIGVEIVLA